VAAVVEGSADDTRTLQERVTGLTEASGTLREDLERTLDLIRDEVVEAGRDLRKELLTKTADHAASLLTRLGELDIMIDEAQADVAERVAALDTAVQRNTTATEQASEDMAALVETTDVLGGIVGGFRKEWPTRTFEVVQGAKAIAEMTVTQVRDEVGGKLDEVARSLTQAAGGVEHRAQGDRQRDQAPLGRRPGAGGVPGRARPAARGRARPGAARGARPVRRRPQRPGPVGAGRPDGRRRRPPSRRAGRRALPRRRGGAAAAGRRAARGRRGPRPAAARRAARRAGR
jgi:hypothetical protein